MRYVIKARVIPDKAAALKQALDDGTFGQGFPFGDLGDNLRGCSVDADGNLRWVETCYCREYSNVAMVMEIEYFEQYLHAIEIQDARDPRFCDGYPHCNDCNCTDSIRFDGAPLSAHLEALMASECSTGSLALGCPCLGRDETRAADSKAAHATLIPTHWTGWRGKVQTDEEARRNTCATQLVS